MWISVNHKTDIITSGNFLLGFMTEIVCIESNEIFSNWNVIIRSRTSNLESKQTKAKKKRERKSRTLKINQMNSAKKKMWHWKVANRWNFWNCNFLWCSISKKSIKSEISITNRNCGSPICTRLHRFCS